MARGLEQRSSRSNLKICDGIAGVEQIREDSRRPLSIDRSMARVGAATLAPIGWIAAARADWSGGLATDGDAGHRAFFEHRVRRPGRARRRTGRVQFADNPRGRRTVGDKEYFFTYHPAGFSDGLKRPRVTAAVRRKPRIESFRRV